MDYYLYRLLNQNENPSMGIAAANPAAIFSVLEHVSDGRLETQYISTCKTLEAVKDFASKGYYNPGETKKIVEIDVTLLLQLVPGCIIIDLTLPDVLEKHIPSKPELIPFGQWKYYQRARNFATKFQEVLLQPGTHDPLTGQWIPSCGIPAECIKVIANCVRCYENGRAYVKITDV